MLTSLILRLVDELASSGDQVLVQANALAERVAGLAQKQVLAPIKKEAYKHTLTELAIDVPFRLGPSVSASTTTGQRAAKL